MWDLAIENGLLVTARGSIQKNLYVKDGKIGAITHTTLPATQILDASDRWVLPGAVDVHVHSRDPGATHKEDFFHSTRAAAAGGVTTILEMPNSVPAVTTVKALEQRRNHLAQRAYVDFGLWALATAATSVEDFSAMARAGACGFKLFWGYALNPHTLSLIYNPQPGEDVLPPPTDGEVLEVFERVRQVGRVLALHAENESINKSLARREHQQAPPYTTFLESRPPLSEAAAIALAIEMARYTGTQIHIVHLSSQDGLRLVTEARLQGVPITAETCPHYITLSPEDYTRVGSLLKVFPPIRAASHGEALRHGLKTGDISFLASDHAPHTPAEKSGDLEHAAAGLPGVETLLPLAIDMAIAGFFTLEEVVRLTALQPAQRFGLWPRKGDLQIGGDADCVVVDPSSTWTVSSHAMFSKNPQTPWDGQTLRGKINATLLRGQTIYQDGVVLNPPKGRFVAHAASLAGPEP